MLMKPDYPMSKIFFKLDEPQKIIDYLHYRHIIEAKEDVTSIEKAGDSNMNFTVRVKKKEGSFIFKQSKPFVEKYPHIPAPEDRVNLEGKFYQITGQSEKLMKQMPKILFRDPEYHVLGLEDLGELSSYEMLYSGQKITNHEVDQLIDWLQTLHGLSFDEHQKLDMANKEMRALNHEHIFDLPLRENNGLNLDEITPGLDAIALSLKKDDAFVKRVHSFGEVYLGEGEYLLHGDYYPASWIKKGDEIFIIDAEFAFIGPREFDVAIMLAHFWLSGQSEALIEYTKSSYSGLDIEMVDAFTGIEIMRRLLGVAQLPLNADLEKKKGWLERSYKLVLGD
jgi:5-methylthioribose kinase